MPAVEQKVRARTRSTEPRPGLIDDNCGHISSGRFRILWRPEELRGLTLSDKCKLWVTELPYLRLTVKYIMSAYFLITRSSLRIVKFHKVSQGSGPYILMMSSCQHLYPCSKARSRYINIFSYTVHTHQEEKIGPEYLMI